MKTSKNYPVLHQKDDLLKVLIRIFDGKMNLSRIKFLDLFLRALCKVQNVCFEKLATGFDSSAQRTSSLRRIQRFMAEYVLETDLIARLIFSLLPHKPPYTLALDRTNWKFGKTNINILVLAITFEGVAFPLLFKLLDKQGNSNTDERKKLLERYILLFGAADIKCLVADREFVGQEWIKYLNANRIYYHIRIRNNFKVYDYKRKELVKVWHLFNSTPIGEVRVLNGLFIVNGEDCYLSGSKIKTKEGIEYQILISYCRPENAYQLYKERWQIECAFKAFKSSGFYFENTHLTDLDRLEKLFALGIVAFTWAYLVGLFLHRNEKPIRLLKHGYKAKTYFKHGLEAIAMALLNPYCKTFMNVFDFLSCT